MAHTGGQPSQIGSDSHPAVVLESTLQHLQGLAAKLDSALNKDNG